MKTILLAGLATTLFATTAAAESYVKSVDPSGSPMCFTGAGQKAPLASCEDSAVYRVTFDPSGAPMCADADGILAPIAHCAFALDLAADDDSALAEAGPLWSNTVAAFLAKLTSNVKVASR